MSDFWSLGCLIFELVAGRSPFTHPNEYTDPAAALRRAARADVCFDSPSDTTTDTTTAAGTAAASLQLPLTASTTAAAGEAGADVDADADAASDSDSDDSGFEVPLQHTSAELAAAAAYASSDCSEWRALVRALLQPSPLERAGCDRGDLDVRDSPWLADFNWLELIERDMQPPWTPSELFLRDTAVQQMAHSWPDASDTYYHGDER
jgi:serine/threonine protein kinase